MCRKRQDVFHRRFVGLRPLFVLVALIACATLPCQSQASDGTRCVQAFPAVYDRVYPAVVSISSMAINPYPTTERVSWTVGSGVILDSSGLILTNSHVVFGRQAVVVTLSDGTKLPGEVIGGGSYHRRCRPPNSSPVNRIPACRGSWEFGIPSCGRRGVGDRQPRRTRSNADAGSGLGHQPNLTRDGLFLHEALYTG